MFLPSHSLDTVSSSDMLFCFEVLSKDLVKEKVVLLRVQQVKILRDCLYEFIYFLVILNMLVFTRINRFSLPSV